MSVGIAEEVFSSSFHKMRRKIMDGVFSCLAFVYLMIAGYFTICFEWAFFTHGGFLAWAFYGSWLAPIYGFLWPFTTNVFY